MIHSDCWAAVVSGSSGLRQNCSARDICWSTPYIALHTLGYTEFPIFCSVFSLLTDIPRDHTDQHSEVCFGFCSLHVFPNLMAVSPGWQQPSLIFSYNLQGIRHPPKHVTEQLLSKYLFTENKVFFEIKE